MEKLGSCTQPRSNESGADFLCVTNRTQPVSGPCRDDAIQVPIIYLLVSHRCMNYRSQCSACGADQHFPNWWPGGNGGGSGKWKISVTREGAALVSRSTTNPVQCKPLRQLTVHRNSPSGQRTNASNEQSRDQAIKLQSKVFSLKGKRGLEFNLLIPHFLWPGRFTEDGSVLLIGGGPPGRKD